MEEKRRLRRRYLLAEVKVKPAGENAVVDAVLMNINRGGLALYAMAPLKKNSRVAVRITYLEDGKPRQSEEVPGVVRWVHSIGQKYAAGVMFTENVSKRNFPHLSKCLAMAMRNK